MANIELELRGECTDDFEALKARLDALAEPCHEMRTMVMFFGEVAGEGVDIRCRVTNGKAEVVTKVGDYHAHDRREIAVDVTVEQVVAFAKLFAVMGFTSKSGSAPGKNNAKVGTRESWEYQIDGVDVSLVRGMSGKAYVEFERLVDLEGLEGQKQELEALAHKLEVNLWTTGEEYYAFCRHFTELEDWKFTGSDKDMVRLKQEIHQQNSL